MAGDARRLLVARRETLRRQTLDTGSDLELRDIEAAIARIDSGTWGRCERCQGAIGRDRLRAVPDARYCVSCG
jgi:RNA polymerase-binding transcription factor DksA